MFTTFSCISQCPMILIAGNFPPKGKPRSMTATRIKFIRRCVASLVQKFYVTLFISCTFFVWYKINDRTGTLDQPYALNVKRISPSFNRSLSVQMRFVFIYFYVSISIKKKRSLSNFILNWFERNTRCE